MELNFVLATTERKVLTCVFVAYFFFLTTSMSGCLAQEGAKPGKYDGIDPLQYTPPETDAELLVFFSAPRFAILELNNEEAHDVFLRVVNEHNYQAIIQKLELLSLDSDVAKNALSVAIMESAGFIFSADELSLRAKNAGTVLRADANKSLNAWLKRLTRSLQIFSSLADKGHFEAQLNRRFVIALCDSAMLKQLKHFVSHNPSVLLTVKVCERLANFRKNISLVTAIRMNQPCWVTRSQGIL